MNGRRTPSQPPRPSEREIESRIDVDDIPLPFCVVRRDATVIAANKALSLRLSRSAQSPSAMRGLSLHSVLAFDKRATLQIAIESGRGFGCELELQRDGARASVWVQGRPIRFAGESAVALTFMELRAVRFEDRQRVQQQQAVIDIAHLLANGGPLEESIPALVRRLAPDIVTLCCVDLISTQGDIQRVSSFAPVHESMSWPAGSPLFAVLEGQTANFERNSAGDVATILGIEGSVPLPSLPVSGAQLLAVPVRVQGRPAGVASFVATAAGGELDSGLCSLLKRVVAQLELALERDARERSVASAIASRDDMMLMASHDIIGPLTSITLLSDILLKTSRSDEERRRFATILRLVDKVARLGRDLQRHLAPEEQASLVSTLVHDTVEVQALVEESCACAQPRAQAKQIRLTFYIATTETSATHVSCDRDSILRVLDNLLGNAIAFTPEGGRIHVVVRTIGDEVRFEVKDNGVGIPPGDLPHIFQRQWRGEHSRGRGLGLHIVKTIIAAHDGRVTAESLPGRGCVLSFTLLRARS